MSSTLVRFPRPSALKLLVGAVALLGLMITFAALATDASAGGDAVVVVNSTANVDDGDCEGPPNAGSGNCTLHEAIDAVNNGDADIIRFHPPVFSKASPGLIDLCEDTGPGSLPVIKRDVIIDSSNTGVVLDGGSEDGSCGDPSPYGIVASAHGNGLDFELDGGKNFDIVNLNCDEDGDDKFMVAAGIAVTGVEQGDADYSLGTIEITGVLVDNVCDDGIVIEATNLEEASITNSELSSNEGAGVDVEIDACADDCELDDSVLDISDNRIQGGVDYPSECDCSDNGVDILYRGVLGSKITANVSENELIEGTNEGVQFDFLGCGDGSGVNVHVDDNEEINGGDYDAVDISIWANGCTTEAGAVAGEPVVVDPGDTTDNFNAVVTVNDNGDIETSGINTDYGEGVTVNVYTCCHESDSSVTVEVNDNGRITGEDDGVAVDTYICCGDDNTSDVTVSDNDEITGEGGVGILVDGFAGSSSDAEFAGAAGGTGWDADDNICRINVEGNDEIDGVDDSGVALLCFAGTYGDSLRRGLLDLGGVAGGGNSSGDNNVTTINLIDNSDIAGDFDGAYINGVAGSFDGEADKNLAQTTVRGNGEMTGDNNDGVEIELLAGSPVDEGDDNDTEATVEENQEIGGNDGDGVDIESFSGGVTDGSEGDGTMVLIVQNGSIEGDGDNDDGIEIDSVVCCDHENTNDISILDNKDEITGHDDDGIDIETCCSVNTITIMGNQDNIRGGDDDGLELDVCGGTIQFPLPFFAGAAGDGPPNFVDCLKNSITNLTVQNNSFNDSEEDGISIENGGVFADDDIKSIITENSIHGNGGDGIDVESGSGLNIGPDNVIHNNGTAAGDNGIEIDWYYGGCVWFHPDFSNKFTANGNRITENSIYDNFGLGIDLVGFDEDDDFFEDDCDTEPTGDADGEGGLADESLVGCVPFTETAINPNDCLAFPELKTQSQNKLVGSACSLCIVEIFWADDNPNNNSHHGEGRTFLATGEADDDGNFSIELPCDLDGGDLTATATDKLKNTSEFSENLSTLGTSDCATDTPTQTNTPTRTNTPAVTNTPTNTSTPVGPTNTPTNTAVPPTATSSKLCGDVNDDGAVNSLDANLILQLVVRRVTTLPNTPSGDVNNNGETNSVDSSLILQMLVNLIGPGDLHCPN